MTGSFDSYIIGGISPSVRAGKDGAGDLKARCFVLQRGKVSIAIAIVDSCMMSRTVCNEAKVGLEGNGHPDRPHSHRRDSYSQRPERYGHCLGTMADPAYTKFLPLKIAEGIRQAHAKLNPPALGGPRSGLPDSHITAAGLQTGPHAVRSLRQPDQVRGHDAPGLPEPNSSGLPLRRMMNSR